MTIFGKKPNKSHVSLLQTTLKVRWTLTFGRAGLFLGVKIKKTRKIQEKSHKTNETYNLRFKVRIEGSYIFLNKSEYSLSRKNAKPRK